MKNRSFACIVSTICFLAATATLSCAQDRFVITGAGLLGEVVESYVRGFKASNSGCNPVIIGATTGKGFRAFADGNAQMVMASRPILPEERDGLEKKGVVPGEKYMGKIALVIITNADNPVEELTLEQLKKLFTGEYTNWSQCGGPDAPVTVTMRAVPQTGAGVLVQQTVMGGAPYSGNAIVMPLYKDTVTACRSSMAIGYIPTTSLYCKDLTSHGVKAIGVRPDGASSPIHASEGVVKETKYPITIPFYLYWNSGTAGDCISGLLAVAKKMNELPKVAAQ